MGSEQPPWRWSNVPQPEAHIGGLVLGSVLTVVWPWPIGGDRRWLRAVGSVVGAGGLGLVAWAVRTSADQPLDAPTNLETTGPYAFSRNPMYVGWTALYLGIALVVNTVWLVVLLPAVLATCDREIRAEERELDRAFGRRYRVYRRRVPRYLSRLG